MGIFKRRWPIIFIGLFLALGNFAQAQDIFDRTSDELYQFLGHASAGYTDAGDFFYDARASSEIRNHFNALAEKDPRLVKMAEEGKRKYLEFHAQLKADFGEDGYRWAHEPHEAVLEYARRMSLSFPEEEVEEPLKPGQIHIVALEKTRSKFGLSKSIPFEYIRTQTSNPFEGLPKWTPIWFQTYNEKLGRLKEQSFAIATQIDEIAKEIEELANSGDQEKIEKLVLAKKALEEKLPTEQQLWDEARVQTLKQYNLPLWLSPLDIARPFPVKYPGAPPWDQQWIRYYNRVVRMLEEENQKKIKRIDERLVEVEEVKQRVRDKINEMRLRNIQAILSYVSSQYPDNKLYLLRNGFAGIPGIVQLNKKLTLENITLSTSNYDTLSDTERLKYKEVLSIPSSSHGEYSSRSNFQEKLHKFLNFEYNGFDLHMKDYESVVGKASDYRFKLTFTNDKGEPEEFLIHPVVLYDFIQTLPKGFDPRYYPITEERIQRRDEYKVRLDEALKVESKLVDWLRWLKFHDTNILDFSKRTKRTLKKKRKAIQDKLNHSRNDWGVIRYDSQAESVRNFSRSRYIPFSTRVGEEIDLLDGIYLYRWFHESEDDGFGWRYRDLKSHPLKPGFGRPFEESKESKKLRKEKEFKEKHPTLYHLKRAVGKKIRNVAGAAVIAGALWLGIDHRADLGKWGTQAAKTTAQVIHDGVDKVFTTVEQIEVPSVELPDLFGEGSSTGPEESSELSGSTEESEGRETKSQSGQRGRPQMPRLSPFEKNQRPINIDITQGVGEHFPLFQVSLYQPSYQFSKHKLNFNIPTRYDPHNDTYSLNPNPQNPTIFSLESTTEISRGYNPIPLPEGFDVARIFLINQYGIRYYVTNDDLHYNQKTRTLYVDIPYYVDVDYMEISYQESGAKDPDVPSDLLDLDKDLLLEQVKELNSYGMKKLAAGIEAHINEAKEKEIKISVRDYTKLIAGLNKYIYTDRMVLGGSTNPNELAYYQRFLNQGCLEVQCQASKGLLMALLNDYFQKKGLESKYKLTEVSSYVWDVGSDTINASGAHIYTALLNRETGERIMFLDATPAGQRPSLIQANETTRPAQKQEEEKGTLSKLLEVVTDVFEELPNTPSPIDEVPRKYIPPLYWTIPEEYKEFHERLVLVLRAEKDKEKKKKDEPAEDKTEETKAKAEEQKVQEEVEKNSVAEKTEVKKTEKKKEEKEEVKIVEEIPVLERLFPPPPYYLFVDKYNIEKLQETRKALQDDYFFKKVDPKLKAQTPLGRIEALSYRLESYAMGRLSYPQLIDFFVQTYPTLVNNLIQKFEGGVISALSLDELVIQVVAKEKTLIKALEDQVLLSGKSTRFGFLLNPELMDKLWGITNQIVQVKWAPLRDICMSKAQQKRLNW